MVSDNVHSSSQDGHAARQVAMHGCGEVPGGKRDLGWNWTERAGVSIIILRDKRALEKIRCLKVCNIYFMPRSTIHLFRKTTVLFSLHTFGHLKIHLKVIS